jgi:pimeloyl-ACP methyl ester carboxylesterase
VFALWLGLGIALSLLVLATLLVVVSYYYLKVRFLDFVIRVFEEKPLFIVPRGEPVADAEDVRFPTTNGLTLCGCYLRTCQPRRQGVILFGLEFGSNRWAAVPYCQFLLDNGFDVFAFESRGQGESNQQPGYEPIQWVTGHEVDDCKAALAYLRGRTDADPRGVGFFGMSKGGSAGLLAAADDPLVRCFVTDGIFSTRGTMVPFMRRWVTIVSNRYRLQALLPILLYRLIAEAGLRRLCRERGLSFPALEKALPKLTPRPLLMIHGQADSYIWPEMAEALFDRARAPKQFWLVNGAKHNQALQVAGEEYRCRVLAFFQAHLAEAPAPDSVPELDYPLPAASPQTPAALCRPEAVVKGG